MLTFLSFIAFIVFILVFLARSPGWVSALTVIICVVTLGIMSGSFLIFILYVLALLVFMLFVGITVSQQNILNAENEKRK